MQLFMCKYEICTTKIYNYITVPPRIFNFVVQQLYDAQTIFDQHFHCFLLCFHRIYPCSEFPFLILIKSYYWATDIMIQVFNIEHCPNFNFFFGFKFSLLSEKIWSLYAKKCDANLTYSYIYL
jgi:hypothetical protein